MKQLIAEYKLIGKNDFQLKLLKHMAQLVFKHNQ